MVRKKGKEKTTTAVAAAAVIAKQEHNRDSSNKLMDVYRARKQTCVETDRKQDRKITAITNRDSNYRKSTINGMAEGTRKKRMRIKREYNDVLSA